VTGTRGYGIAADVDHAVTNTVNEIPGLSWHVTRWPTRGRRTGLACRYPAW
jgi:hypothetical protein